MPRLTRGSSRRKKAEAAGDEEKQEDAPAPTAAVAVTTATTPGDDGSGTGEVAPKRSKRIQRRRTAILEQEAKEEAEKLAKEAKAKTKAKTKAKAKATTPKKAPKKKGGKKTKAKAQPDAEEEDDDEENEEGEEEEEQPAKKPKRKKAAAAEEEDGDGDAEEDDEEEEEEEEEEQPKKGRKKAPAKKAKKAAPAKTKTKAKAKPKEKPARLTKKQKQAIALREKSAEICKAHAVLDEGNVQTFQPPSDFEYTVPDPTPLVFLDRNENGYDTRNYHVKVDGDHPNRAVYKTPANTYGHAFGKGIVDAGPYGLAYDASGRTFSVMLSEEKGAVPKTLKDALKKRKPLKITAKEKEEVLSLSDYELFSGFTVGFFVQTEEGVKQKESRSTSYESGSTSTDVWVVKSGGVPSPLHPAHATQTPRYHGFDESKFSCGGHVVCPAMSKMKPGDVITITLKPVNAAMAEIVVEINGQPAQTLQKPKGVSKDQVVLPIRVPITADISPFVVLPDKAGSACVLYGTSGFGFERSVYEHRKKCSEVVDKWGSRGRVVANRMVEDFVARGAHKELEYLLQHGTATITEATPRTRADCFHTAVDTAIINNDVTAFNLVSSNDYSRRFGTLPTNSIAADTNTGSVGRHTYAHRVGKIGVARGGKEGNSAFIQWENSNTYDEFSGLYQYQTEGFLAAARSPDITDKMLQAVVEGPFQPAQLLAAAVECGNVATAYTMLKYIEKNDTSAGITEVHHAALNPKKALPKGVQARSITKKGNGMSGITPLHMAAACANLARFKAMLKIAGQDFSLTDDAGRALIHYAAANPEPDNVKLLLDLGAKATETDSLLMTPLHIAAKFGRAETIPLLLAEARKSLRMRLFGDDDEDAEEELDAAAKRKIKQNEKKVLAAGLDKNKKGHTPLHLAAYMGHADAVSAFYDFDNNMDMDIPDRNRRTPLMVACMQGHLAVIATLIEDCEAELQKPDKRKYTALHHACKNGHFDAAQFLLRQGFDPNLRDSSGNSPAHYAAAYDWVNILQLLAYYGADLSQANDWKATPLSIAVAKSALCCVLYLLTLPNTDVSALDNEGRTLLHHAVFAARSANLRIVEHLLEKGCDPKKADLKKVTPLHLVAELGDIGPRKVQIAKLLIDNGAMADAEDEQNRSPLSIALNNSNTEMLVTLISGDHSFSEETVKKAEENFMHKLVKLGQSSDIRPIWDVMLGQGKNVLAALFNGKNHASGLTPLAQMVLAAKRYGASNPTTSGYSYGSSYGGGKRSRFGYSHKASSSSSASSKGTLSDLEMIIKMLEEAREHGDADFNVRIERTIKSDEGKEGEASAAAAAMDDEPDSDSEDDSDSDDDDDDMSVSDDDSEDSDDGGSGRRAAAKKATGKAKTAAKAKAKASDDNTDNGDGDGKEGEEEGEKLDLSKYSSDHVVELTRDSSFYQLHDSDLHENPDKTYYVGEDRKKVKGRRFLIKKELDLEHGGCTLLHLACSVENPYDLINALLKNGADPNIGDRLGQTPLMYAVNSGLPGTVKALLDAGADPNAVTARSGLTAVHIAVDKALAAVSDAGKRARIEVLKMLLNAGANGCAQDKTGTLVLNDAVAKNNMRVVNALLACKVDYLERDSGGKAAFHVAVQHGNMDLVVRLLDDGTDVDYPTEKGTTALSIAVKKDNQQLAEVLLRKGADVNAKRKDGLFPLYFAIRNSASQTYRNFEMEQLLMSNGADVTLTSNLNRNILHAAFLAESQTTHNSFDTKRNVYDPIEIVSDICSLENVNLDLADSFGRTPLHYASLSGAILTARYLIKRNANPNAVDVDGNTPLQLALLGHQINYAALLLDYADDLKRNITYTVMETDPVTKKSVQKKHTTSTFRFLAQHHFTRLACVFIDHGVDVLTAFQDCISVCEYQMAMTLLRKTPASIVSSLKDENGNTLIAFVVRHIMPSTTGFTAAPAMLKTLIDTYKFSPKTLNKQKESHLHQACLSGVKEALPFVAAACKADAKRKDGLDTLSLLRLGHAVSTALPTFVEALIERGVDVNYYDSIRESIDVTKVHLDEEAQGWTTLQAENQHKRMKKITKLPLVWSLFQGAINDLEDRRGSAGLSSLQEVVQYCENAAINKWIHESLPYKSGYAYSAAAAALLVSAGLNWHAHGADGITFLQHLVDNRKGQAIERFLALGHTLKKPFDVSLPLPAKSQPIISHIFASWTNPFAFPDIKDLVKQLSAAGCDVDMTDADGRSALWYALRIADRGTIDFLKKTMRASLIPATAPEREVDVDAVAVEGAVGSGDSINVQADALAGLTDVENEIEEERRKKGKPEGPEVDAASNLTKAARVAKVDGTDEDYYDVALTITDVTYGYYGRHDFYRMQVLYNHVQDMFVLWTRWGRVGEKGMHQTTPYPTKEAAVAEFCKVFKSKTTNHWDQRHDFVPKDGRYLLQKHAHDTIAKRQEAAMKAVDFAHRESDGALPKSAEVLVRIATDVKTLRETMVTDSDFDLGFGGADPAVINRAFDILREVKPLATKLKDMGWSDPDRAEVNDKVNKLSNEFFQTVPLNAVKSRIRALDADLIVEYEEKLNTLYIENTSASLLLGAYHKLKQAPEAAAAPVSPFAYMYKANGAKLWEVPMESGVYNTVKEYMTTTSAHPGSDDVHIAQVFAVQGSDHADFMAKHANDPNRRLLWHGTKATNVLGILNQGLRCAPRNAQVTGYMFGKGVYFADTFSKSLNYTHMFSDGNEFTNNHSVMFLAEVALGRIEERYEAKFTPAGPGYNSVLGRGQSIPTNAMTLVDDDVTVPMGPLQSYKRHPTSLMYNEYIVYDSSRIRIRYMVILRKTSWWKRYRAKVKVGRGLLDSVTAKDDEPVEGPAQFSYYPAAFAAKKKKDKN